MSLSIFKIFLLLLQSAAAELICSRQPITALVGDDVILTCHLKPAVSANFETVVWTKPGLNPEYVHFHQDGRLMFAKQNPSYYFRTRLFVNELTNGNVSMKIFKVKISDAGKYFCTLKSLQKKASIQLTVGAVSTPFIKIVSNKTGEVVLQCESEGWYPKPKVLWLHGEGNVLSARPTNTSRGPDGLYSVSRRLIVNMMTSSNRKSFTCRVKQKNINQTREATIYVPGDFFIVRSSFVFLWLSFLGIVCLAFIIAVINNCTTSRGHKKRNCNCTWNCM